MCVIIRVGLQEKSTDHQSLQDSSLGEHECLYKILWKSIWSVQGGDGGIDIDMASVCPDLSVSWSSPCSNRLHTFLREINRFGNLMLKSQSNLINSMWLDLWTVHCSVSSHQSHTSDGSSNLTQMLSILPILIIRCTDAAFGHQHVPLTARLKVSQTVSFLSVIVRCVVSWTWYHYITPDGSLAPPLICIMFMRPACIHTRAALWSRSPLGLYKITKGVCPQTCLSSMCPYGSPSGLVEEWSSTDLIYCNKPYIT